MAVKFGIDKRAGHLSDLINSGQITREQALSEFRKPAYPAELLKSDYDFVLKKFGLTEEELQRLMKLPPRTFRDYPNSYALVQALRWAVNHLRRLGLYPR
jgi:hypothetical protein